MLSWDDFQYVKAIADSGSLGGAAQSLGVNHSTVWRRLGQIEHEIKVCAFAAELLQQVHAALRWRRRYDDGKLPQVTADSGLPGSR